MIVVRRITASLLCFLVVTACASSVRAQEAAACPPPEPRWHSEAWWQMKAQEPVGARQFEKEGKLWPPYPRPVGPKQECCHVFHAAHYWPWPYTCIDRQVVLDMSRAQEANGWLTETTLYDYHFDPDTNELTVPGKLQLKWILEYVPGNYRTVWLQQSDDAAVSQQRLNSVRNVAVKLVGEPNVPPITFRTAMAPARPAIEVDTIRRSELGSIPTPRIPFEASASGASSTATGNSNQGQ